jgi:hypothetical protein
MKHLTIWLLVSAFILSPALAGAVDEQDFEVNNTRDLINLCTVSPDDPLYHSAVNFCHGFLVGAVRYHDAMAMGPNGNRLYCLPEPAPTRNEAIAMFVDWARDHPQYMEEPAVETEFRFLTEKWPCK